MKSWRKADASAGCRGWRSRTGGQPAGRGCRSLTCLSLPAEVGGSGHSTGAQSWPRAAAHGARTPAGPCGSGGVCLPHMPLGKLGLSGRVGWGEGAGPSGHREGTEPPWGGVWVGGGSWNLEKPTPTLDSQFQPWASSLPLCQHRAVQGPGFAKRELWIVPSLTPGGGLLVGLLPSVSSPVGGGGLETHPLPAPVTPQCLCLSSSAQAVSFPLGRQSSKSPGPRRHRSRRRPGRPRLGPGRVRWPRNRQLAAGRPRS